MHLNVMWQRIFSYIFELNLNFIIIAASQANVFFSFSFSFIVHFA